MILHIDLSPEIERFIKDKVDSGVYGSATEVVRDAIRRMQQDEARRDAFRAAIAKGDAELERGEGILYTPDLMSEISRRAARAEARGEPIDPDVLP